MATTMVINVTAIRGCNKVPKAKTLKEQSHLKTK